MVRVSGGARVLIAIALALLVGAVAWFGARGVRREAVVDMTAAERSAASPTPSAQGARAVTEGRGDVSRASPAASRPRVDVAALEAARRVYREGSLRGSARDGRVALRAGGLVVANEELRRLFDWYLAATGELTLAQIRLVLEADMLDELGVGTAADVMALFDRYTNYLAAVATTDGDAPATRLARIAALRRAWLGDDIAAELFGDEEAYARRTLDRLAIARDASLTEAQRTERLAAFDASQPATTRDAMDAATVAAVVDAETRALDAAGADADARHRARAESWGDTAATRLARLDEERAAWASRVAAYQRERDALRADGSLDDVGRARAIANLRARMFDETQARRVASLEEIGEI